MSEVYQLRIDCPLSLWGGKERACQWCNAELDNPRRTAFCSDAHAREWERNHRWNRARAYAKRRARYRCQRCGAGKEAGLEVNHVVPVNGAGYGDGCPQHHQENLEVLCHDCHVRTTNEQRAAGLIGPRGLGRYQVRRMDTTHLTGVVALERTLFGDEAWPEEPVRHWFNEGRLTGVVAVDARGEVIGFASALSITDTAFDQIVSGDLHSSHLDFQHSSDSYSSWWMGAVCVAPDWRRKGLGRCLLTELGHLPGRLCADAWSAEGAQLMSAVGWKRASDGARPAYVAVR